MQQLLAIRHTEIGQLQFGINDQGFIACLKTSGGDQLILPERFKYVPTALVEHLLPGKKDTFTQAYIQEKNLAFVHFLKTQTFTLKKHETTYSLEFSYSESTYYAQVALSTIVVGGSFFTGGLAAPILFSVGSSMLMYSAFQPCQDLDWGSFALEGTIGGITSAATAGMGGLAKNARAVIKTAESPLARQVMHFGINGAASVGAQLVGSAIKAGAKGDTQELSTALNPKLLASTAIAGGLGGFAGAVAGRVTPSTTGTVPCLAAGSIAGAAGGACTTVIWNHASHTEITADIATATFRGAVAGASTGAEAGRATSLKYSKIGNYTVPAKSHLTYDSCEEPIIPNLDPHAPETYKHSAADHTTTAKTPGISAAPDLQHVKLKDGKSPLMQGTKVIRDSRVQTIWTSAQSIKRASFLDIVVEKVKQGKSILILSGSHGTPDGLVGKGAAQASNLEAFTGDLATFGNLSKVHVVNICDASSAKISELIANSTHDEIICAWCWSDQSLAVAKTLPPLSNEVATARLAETPSLGASW